MKIRAGIIAATITLGFAFVLLAAENAYAYSYSSLYAYQPKGSFNLELLKKQAEEWGIENNEKAF